MDFLKPHRRFNPLSGEWVKVSPHRTKRPWNGQTEDVGGDELPQHDEGCYLCPGNMRAGGVANPKYEDTYVFDNDFAALLPGKSGDEGEISNAKGLITAKQERGLCRVICFSPRHDLTLARMPQDAVERVVSLWADQYQELGEKDFINHVQIFENRGAIMGCSNPHPHGQVWAEEILPDIPAREVENQKKYLNENGSSMLMDYLDYELESKDRLIAENDHFVSLVPFWAVWPYEVMILPKARRSSLVELSSEEKSSLAAMMKIVGIRFDNLFKTSFPYSMGIHQAPTDGQDHSSFQMHLHYMPPLLRSATVKKFMVGYELLGMPQRDITAELAAETLRNLPEVHYKEAK